MDMYAVFLYRRLLRSAGLNDQVTATWEISPSDTTIFTTTSSTVVFADGQSEATVTVQVRLILITSTSL